MSFNNNNNQTEVVVDIEALKEEILKSIADEYNRFYNQTTRAVLLVYFAIIELIGIPGNTLILYIFGKKMTKSSPTNALILILAASDLTTLIMAFPYQLSEAFIQKRSLMTCKINSFIKATSFCLELLILLLLAIDRYTGISHAHRHKVLMSNKRLLIAIICVSVISISYGVFNAIGKGTRYYDREHKFYIETYYCKSKKYMGDSTMLHLSATVATILFIIFITIITLYSLALFRVYKGSKRAVPGVTITSQNKNTILVIIILLASVILFLTWLPFVIMNLVGVQVYLFYYFLYINNITNFILFITINNSFRKEVKSIILKCLCVKASRVEQSQS